jgi:hypothetical protein
MKKALTTLFIISSVSLSVNGFDLTFDSFSNGDPIRDKFSVVHFTLPDTTVNNFQGWFFWLPTKQLPISAWTCGGKTHNYMQWCVSYNSTSKPCSKQVRGLYYTNAKGSRLWPLDQQSLNWLRLLNADYNNLQVSDGLYTTCGTSWSAEIYSIYGQISYYDTIIGTWLGTVSAWLAYDIPNNAVDTTVWLFPTLQYFNNQTPLWYIYDNIWGIGFVGWQLPPIAHSGVLNLIKTNTGKNINNIFGIGPNGITLPWFGGPYTLTTGANAGIDTVWNISVLGNVLLSRGGLEVTDRQSILGNPSRTSSIVFSDVVNTSDILNTLRKNADTACRGQQKITAGGDLTTLYSGNPRTICIYNDNGGDDFNLADGSDIPVEIDLSNVSSYNGIEIVVKWRNVVLQWSVPSKEYAINLFVDNGNVLLKNGTFASEVVAWNTYSTNYAVFDAKWSVMNNFEDIEPIVNNVIAAIPWWGAQTNYLATNWNVNAHPQVSARFIYDTLIYAAGQGNTWAIGAINYGVYLRWNIFVNGLLVWWDAGNVPSGITNKYYIHGRLASLNTALEPSLQRKDLINDTFWGYWALLQSYINFANTFWRQCILNGYAADSYGVQTQQPCKVSNDVFKFNPLVLINTWAPSRLLP